MAHRTFFDVVLFSRVQLSPDLVCIAQAQQHEAALQQHTAIKTP
jgi:hypothetical protein